MKAALAIGYFTVFCLLLRLWKPITSRALTVGLSTFVVLVGLVYLNDSQEIIAEKVASFVSYDMYKGIRYVNTFVIQYILAYIPFKLFDYEYTAHAMNIAIQAFVYLIASQYIFKNKLSWKFAIFLLFPSYYHYAMFGLRDPIINFTAVLIVIAIFNTNQKGFVLTCLILSLMCLFVRPEFSIIIIGFISISLFLNSNNITKFMIVVGSGIMLYVMLLLMPYAFGVDSSGSALGNIEIISNFNESRALRNVDRVYGSGSQILGGGLFSLNWFVRYPIQLVASYVAPLPMDIRGGFDYFAFMESVVFCFVVGYSFLRRKINSRSELLFWCGFIYMALQAIFAANYGNILRIRYPCLIFFIGALVAADFSFTRRKSRRPLR